MITTSGFNLLVATAGVIGGLLFWAIRRPDRDRDDRSWRLGRLVRTLVGLVLGTVGGTAVAATIAAILQDIGQFSEDFEPAFLGYFTLGVIAGLIGAFLLGLPLHLLLWSARRTHVMTYAIGGACLGVASLYVFLFLALS